MPDTKVGNRTITGVYVGSKEIKAIYIGSRLVYSKSSVD